MPSDPGFSRRTPPEEQHLVILPAAEQHTGTVIFLHGLGQRAQDWTPFVQSLAERLPGVKWILPQASSNPVTMNDGQKRPSWFDIFHLPPCSSCGVPGSAASITRIEQIILTEIHAISQPRKVVIAGFSQGAALSILLALTTLHDLGGVASLSGWIPRKCRQAAQYAQDLPVFWGHGIGDEEIPYDMAQESINFLRQGLGFTEQRITFKGYHGLAHAVTQREMSDLAEWLTMILT